MYESTGTVSRFTDYGDPRPRSRPVFSFHRPENFRERLQLKRSLRDRLQDLPALETDGLRDCQINAIINLDAIPDRLSEIKAYYEKYYSTYPVNINKPGRYVHVSNDGIYTYMYEVSEAIEWVKDEKGDEYMEFFLV